MSVMMEWRNSQMRVYNSKKIPGIFSLWKYGSFLLRLFPLLPIPIVVSSRDHCCRENTPYVAQTYSTHGHFRLP